MLLHTTAGLFHLPINHYTLIRAVISNLAPQRFRHLAHRRPNGTIAVFLLNDAFLHRSGVLIHNFQIAFYFRSCNWYPLLPKLLHNPFGDSFCRQPLERCIGQQFFFRRIIDERSLHQNGRRFCPFQDIPGFRFYPSVCQSIGGN